MFETGQLLVFIPHGTVVQVTEVGSAWMSIRDIRTQEVTRVPEERYSDYRLYEGGR